MSERLLVDTHALLWALGGDDRLSARAAALLTSADTERLLSHASLWEMAIKKGLGRLELPCGLAALVREHVVANGVALLATDVESVLAVEELPLHHRDPFDRLLVAQAMVHDLALLSADEVFDAYGVRRVW